MVPRQSSRNHTPFVQRMCSGHEARYDSRLRRVSATLSPPNLSSAYFAKVRRTMASATTDAAGTAVLSERWLMACADSPVSTSTVRRALGMDGIGFMAPRTRITWPLDIPPSMPPARLDRRSIRPSALTTISSCACEPGREASRKPSPISTPLNA